MSRRGNDEQIIVDLNRLLVVNHLLDAQSGRAIVGVHESPAVESFAKQLMIRNVVFVRKQHSTDTAHCLDSPDQLTGESWRVDQDVAAFARRSSNQVAPCTKAGFSREAAEVNVVLEQEGKGVDADVSVVVLARADRS